MIKAIIFDWGGVLVDNPVEKLMEYCADSLGVTHQNLKSSFFQYESEFQKGLITEDDLWKTICDKLKVNHPITKSLWKEAVISVFREKEGVFRLAQNLKKNGYKIGFLSNTEIPTMEYFFDKGYEKYFDVKVFSCAEKTIKPEERIYHIALDRLQVKPDETIFIDDKPEYVEGAQQIGIHGIVFKNINQLNKELTKFQTRMR